MFAHLLHIGPAEMDALPWPDFVVCARWCDAYLEARKQAARG